MKRNQGFTLVELLVVIGIIALLISILLPALGRVRWQANMTACSARMRDIVMSIQMYANDNKGAIPPWPGDDGKPTFSVYNGTSNKAGGNALYQFSNRSGSAGTTGVMSLLPADDVDAGAQLGRLWKMRYLKTPKVFWCPSTKSDLPAGGTPPRRDFRYYTYNANFKYADAAGTVFQPWWKKIARYGIVPEGVKFKNGYTGTDMVTLPPVFVRPILIDTVFEYDGAGDKGAVAHSYGNRRGYNLAYADGHVGNYVENNFMTRPGYAFIRMVNFTQALSAAAAGAPVTFSTTAWLDNNNSPYYAVPVMPN